MHCKYFDTTQKGNHSSFPTVVGGQHPFRLKFALKVTHPLKSPTGHIFASNTFYIKASENSIIVNNKKKKSFNYPLVQNGGS